MTLLSLSCPVALSKAKSEVRFCVVRWSDAGGGLREVNTNTPDVRALIDDGEEKRETKPVSTASQRCTQHHTCAHCVHNLVRDQNSAGPKTGSVSWCELPISSCLAWDSLCRIFISMGQQMTSSNRSFKIGVTLYQTLIDHLK